MSEIYTRRLWEEERLYVLQTLADLKGEQKRQGESAAAERAALLEKAVRDINVAHDRIRKLEDAKTSLRVKNWAMALALSGIGAIVFAIFEKLLQEWKR